jgi:hypothetical protein
MSNISGKAISQLGIISENSIEEVVIDRPPLDLKCKIESLFSVKQELEESYKHYPKKEIYDSLTLISSAINSLKN